MNKTDKVSVQIVENFKLIRESLKYFLNKQENIAVTDCFSEFEDYFCGTSVPDVLIAGMRSCAQESVEILQKVKAISPNTKVFVLFIGASSQEVLKFANLEVCDVFTIETKYEKIVEKLNSLFNI